MRLSLAALLGACIGALRASHPRSAWVGVHALLALGSYLLTMTALLGFTGAPVRGQVQGDPTRIISWILLGSGLLGAGSLCGQQGRPTVAMLATAAALWVVAALGVLLIVSIGLLSRLAKRSFPSR